MVIPSAAVGYFSTTSYMIFLSLCVVLICEIPNCVFEVLVCVIILSVWYAYVYIMSMYVLCASHVPLVPLYVVSFCVKCWMVFRIWVIVVSLCVCVCSFCVWSICICITSVFNIHVGVVFIFILYMTSYDLFDYSISLCLIFVCMCVCLVFLCLYLCA